MKRTALLTAIVLMLAVTANLGALTTIPIGSGSDTNFRTPVYAQYSYSYTQQIFLQSEINVTGEIQKIRFWYISGSITNSRDWVVFLGHTNKNFFSSITDMVPYSALTQVYAGDVSSLIPTSAGWMEITLQTPFAYNNSDNLVIAVDENTAGTSGAVDWGTFARGADPATDYLSLYVFNSTTNIDPVTVTTANSRTFQANRIQLDIEEPQVPVELSAFTALISSENFINLTWISQSETNLAGYYLYRSTNDVLADAIVISPLIPATNSPTQHVYSYEDKELFANGVYNYWLQSVDIDGSVAYHGPVAAYYNAHGEYSAPEIPQATELLPAYPNPFNPQLFIPFSLVRDSQVRIRIFNSRGQLQQNFELGSKAQGNHQVVWNGTDLDGRPAGSGVYHIVMTAGKDVFTRKAVLIK